MPTCIPSGKASTSSTLRSDWGGCRGGRGGRVGGERMEGMSQERELGCQQISADGLV